MTDVADEIPGDGAVFTFGKSRFADNIASKFWIRNDRINFAACGDEHSAVVTDRGRLYTFGSNDWGQLGHGHTRLCNKPTSVKGLKAEKIILAACGRSHTLVATESGKLFTFGAGGDGQLGHNSTQDCHVPRQIECLPEREYKMLSCGVYHSAALTVAGEVYTWGSSSEGENGHKEGSTLIPKKLEFRRKVIHVSCGYYHTGVVTDDGKVHTFGESENGKLGIAENLLSDTSQPQAIQSSDKYEFISCGARHSAVITRNGRLQTFGDGMHGQLGNGTAMLQCSQPTEVAALRNIIISTVSVGECHTAAISDKGKLYTFGDGRHGKLAQGDECFSNLFSPLCVSQFKGYTVTGASCGGCHTLAMALKVDSVDRYDDDSEDALASSMLSTAPSLKFGNDTTILSNTASLISPRDRRRLKDMNSIEDEEKVARTLFSPRSDVQNSGEESTLKRNTLPKLRGFSEREDQETTSSRPMPLPRPNVSLLDTKKHGKTIIEENSKIHRRAATRHDDSDEGEDVSSGDEEHYKRETEIGEKKRQKKGNSDRIGGKGSKRNKQEEIHKETVVKSDGKVKGQAPQNRINQGSGSKASIQTTNNGMASAESYDEEYEEEESDEEDDDDEEYDDQDNENDDDDSANSNQDEPSGEVRDVKNKSEETTANKKETNTKKPSKKKKKSPSKQNDETVSSENLVVSEDSSKIVKNKNSEANEKPEKADTAVPATVQKSGFLSFFKKKKPQTQPPPAAEIKQTTPENDTGADATQKSGVCIII